MLRAGASRLDITPPLGTKIPGYFEERRARAVRDPLQVKCIALESGGSEVALVLCDLIGVKRAILDRAKARIRESTGLPPERVLISCTHTHTGAETGEDAYTEGVIRRIADGVALARDRREPAEAGWGSVAVEGLAFNRRYRMKDGSVQTNPGIGNLEVLEPAGPVDPMLRLLALRRPDGSPLGVWANYGLHYVGVPGDMETISADYFGVFGDMLGRLRGERFVAALSHGPSGDINNLDVLGGRNPRNDRGQHLESVGAKMAVAALWIWNEIEFQPDVMLDARMAEVTLKRRDPPSPADRERAREIEARMARSESITMAERGFLWMLGPWKEDETAESKTWVQALRIGGLGIATAPGELFCEPGLAIGERSPFDLTMTAELANDTIGYLPSGRAFEEGGYESETSHFQPGVGERIVETALELLEHLYRSEA